MKGSVRGRVLAGVGVGAGVAFAIAGVLVFVLVRSVLVAQFEDGLRTKAKALSILVEQGEGGGVETEDISPNVPPGEYFEIAFEGKTLLRSNSTRSARMRSVRLEVAPRGESDEETIARPLVTIVYARATDELDASLARIRNILIGVGAASLVLLLVALYAITRRGLLPVEQLAADIATVHTDVLAPISDDRPRELVGIAQRLNELLGRVDQAMQRERALTAEVAHELRTPLTGLRTTIEVALDRERTPDRYRDALAQCLAITRQTERMVESMLSLAKLDAGIVEITREPVALDALLRELAGEHVELVLEPVTVETDRTKLSTVLHNLVDNALAYGGKARIELTPAHIRITNPTTLTDATHVFQRFWRGDAARTAGTHAGLGLAICKRLVEALGWSITAGISEGNFIATITTSKTHVDSSRPDP
jgi:signal transduction histidine kinase